MKKISELIGKYMAWIVLAIAALALFLPGTCLWIQTKWVNYLLMVVMFGMGLTMKLSDFAVVFSRPRDVLIGCTAQFIFMPLLAFSVMTNMAAGVAPDRKLSDEEVVETASLIAERFGNYMERVIASL